MNELEKLKITFYDIKIIEGFFYNIDKFFMKNHNRNIK